MSRSMESATPADLGVTVRVACEYALPRQVEAMTADLESSPVFRM